jgi:hypothetical protein
MDNPQQPDQKPPLTGRGKILFLLLALAPIPVGFLFDPSRLFDPQQRAKLTGPVIVLNILTIFCCVAGTTGMCGGFKKGAWSDRFLGLMLGIILWIVEGFIISFIGCCQGLSHL